MKNNHALIPGLGLLFLAPSFARADGLVAHPLPDGFQAVVQTADLPRVPRPTGAMQSLHEEAFVTRPALHGQSHDVGELPLVEIDAPTDATPTALPASVTTEVAVLRGKRISISGFDAGILEIAGANRVGTGRQSDGGATPCSAQTWPSIKRFDYAALRRTDDEGNFELAFGKGFVDTASCKVAVANRATVRPAPLVPGLVFGFRTHCAECKEDARDEVHLITPQVLQGGMAAFDVVTPFSHFTFAAGPARSSVVEGQMSDTPSFGPTPWSMPGWTQLFGRGATTGAEATNPQFFGFACGSTLRLEIAQGTEERQPTLWVGCN